MINYDAKSSEKDIYIDAVCEIWKCNDRLV